MIHVTQGHENSVGIETFIKSMQVLEKSEISKIVLHGFKESIDHSLSSMDTNYSLEQDKIVIGSRSIKVNWLSGSHLPESTLSLESALNSMKDGDVLFTLPTSKDQLILNETKCKGYTEFFRKKFGKDRLSMIFHSSDEDILLLTDHISVDEISNTITTNFIFEKISDFIINSPERYENIIFSGVNPHCGEGGLLGTEDKFIEEASDSLREKFPEINFIGPVSADAVFSLDLKNSIKVFSYHDQGLSYFKNKYGYLACNITIGLPFVRVSPDHGTAFNIYKKNCANYLGCLYSLEYALSANYEHKHR